jgi:VPDSG-CTERM motif
MLAFAQNASAARLPLPPTPALAFDDTLVVGTVTPVTPASPEARADYINFMIALAPGGSGVLDGNTITRSTNLFGSLPAADATGALTGDSTTIDLGAGGVFTYLFAKYDGQNDISFVWKVSGLTGIVEIPLDGPLGHQLSGWVLFGGGGNGVPDGGTTVMLLGAALGALGMVRRYLKS